MHTRPGITDEVERELLAGPEAKGDPFLSAAPAARAAARAGATTVALDGSGHWWMLEDPARAAAVPREFWATLA